MLRPKERLVEKKYVHKHKEENVLLMHLRRSLPVTIDAAVFDNIILPMLSEKNRHLLLQYYLPVHKSDQKYFYCLDGIHGALKKNMIKPFIQRGQFNEKEMTALLEFYELDETEQKYYLKKDLTVVDEIAIQNIMHNRDRQIVDQNYREKIAEILERTENIEKKDVFTCKMHIDPNHSFFFEHPCDHVPGLMIIEAARQFFIATGHLYGNIPLQGMRTMLSALKISFKQYLELNFPIKMIGIVKSVKKSRENVWLHVEFAVTFYQRNQLAAKISFTGKALDEKLFEYIRMDNFNYGYIPRFKLSDKYVDYMVIRDQKNNEFICKIIDISDKGFQLLSESELVDVRKSAPYEFYAFFQTIGMVHGKCILRWTKQYGHDSYYYTGFKISRMSKNDMKNLDRAIKKHCFIKRDRKYIETADDPPSHSLN